MVFIAWFDFGLLCILVVDLIVFVFTNNCWFGGGLWLF